MEPFDPDYDEVDNQRVYFANDGGVYVTEDVSIAVGSSGWQEYVYLQIHRSTSGGLANSSSYIFDSVMEADEFFDF